MIFVKKRNLLWASSFLYFDRLGSELFFCVGFGKVQIMCDAGILLQVLPKFVGDSIFDVSV